MEEKKKKIFWGVTYSRHSSFPKKGTSRRIRDILEQMNIITKERLDMIPDARFPSIATNIKLGKTTITKKKYQR